MNKAVVVFLKDEQLVHRLIESGISLCGAFVQVQPLATPTSRVTISNVPPFIPDPEIEREPTRFRKFAIGIRMVPLGCKTLNVSFRCTYEGRSFMLYASTGEMRCYECGARKVILSC